MVKHLTYDALGRLVRVQSPFPDLSAPSGQVRSERFLYDGVRRIQEVVTDPLVTMELDGVALASPLQAVAAEAAASSAEPLDPNATPAILEEAQVQLSRVQDPEPDPIPLPTINQYLAREYIWGPGDNGVDELLVQFDQSRYAAWAMHDAAGDLVALADLGGPSGSARVVAQWTYDAYGSPLSADVLQSHARPHLGHKGLFVDRLDAPVSQAGAEPPRVIPFAQVLCQNRNRAYQPGTGRFLQKDPNASALTLVENAAYHGASVAALSVALNIETLYGDGLNLYEYLGSNPGNRSDPLGLSWDPFDMVDDYIAESAGNAAALMSQLGQDLKAAAIVAANIASMLPFPVVSNLGDVALWALGEQSSGEFAAGVAIGLIPGGKLLAKAKGLGAKLMGFAARIATSAWQGATYYAKKYGGRLARTVGGLADRAAQAVRKSILKGGCGCFTRDTLVRTAAGLVSIGSIGIGDLVLTRDESTGELSYRPVTAVVVTPRAALLELSIRHIESGNVELLETTDEHPFWVEGAGWRRADSLVPGVLLKTASGTAVLDSLAYSSARAEVRNISVQGNPNYFVGPDGIWVHNCWEGLHHLIPKYLGGDKDGLLRHLPHDQHVRIHALIDEIGAGYGIPKRSSRGATSAVEAWVKKDPVNRIRDLKDTLIQAYTKFDAEFNTSLLGQLLGELKKQGF